MHPVSFRLRFQTHSDLGGTEKFAITCTRPEYDLQPPIVMDAEDVSVEYQHLLPPHQLVFVKGWSRSVAALTLCFCMWEMPEFLQADRSSSLHTIAK